VVVPVRDIDQWIAGVDEKQSHATSSDQGIGLEDHEWFWVSTSFSLRVPKFGPPKLLRFLILLVVAASVYSAMGNLGGPVHRREMISLK
jgi:hypothetical protein